MAERQLLVRIIGDDKDLQRAFTRSEKAAKGFQGQMVATGTNVTRAFAAAGVTLGLGALTAAAGKSVQAASDLNEQISRTEVILGDSADAAIKWSETTADAFGISQRAALAALSTFASLFQNVGIGATQAAEFGQRIVQLAADLASLQNTSPEEALLALRSGLSGESEPLRRYTIFLNETNVAQKAMADSGKENVKALTLQEKTLARYSLILQQSEKAHGNFAATSDELANQTRILNANLDNLSTQIGGALIPGFVDATDAAIGLLDVLGKIPNALQEIEDSIPGANKSLLDFLGFEDVELNFDTSLIDIVKGIKASFEETERDLGSTIPTSERTAQAIAELAQQERKKAEAAREAGRESRGARKAFDEFVVGSGLALQRAQVTESLADDLAVLRALENAIQRRIRVEGRTFALVSQLVDTRARIADLTAEQAEDAQRRSADAFDRLVGSLDLNLDRARVTATLRDDLRALQALEDAIQERIRAEGRTLELERQLFDVRRQQADARQGQRERSQFLALGLTGEGDERTPSARALRRRLGSLRNQVEGTVLDTRQTESQLDRIARVLSGQFGKVGKDVRVAILKMFQDINDALDQEEDEQPFARFRKVTARELTRGLDLPPSELRRLRSRLSQLSGGRIPNESVFGIQPPSGGVVVAGDVNVTVAGGNPDAVMRAIQNKVKKRAATRTGRRRGRRSGLN